MPGSGAFRHSVASSGFGVLKNPYGGARDHRSRQRFACMGRQMVALEKLHSVLLRFVKSLKPRQIAACYAVTLHIRYPGGGKGSQLTGPILDRFVSRPPRLRRSFLEQVPFGTLRYPLVPYKLRYHLISAGHAPGGRTLGERDRRYSAERFVGKVPVKRR